MIEAADVSSTLDRFLKNLTLDRNAHIAADDGAEVLAENEALARDVQACRDKIVASASMRRDRRVKDRKHREILPVCAAAREAFEKWQRAVEPANSAYLTADSAFTYAKDNLAKHLANPLQSEMYPNAKQIREWNLTKHALEKKAEEKGQELRAAVAEREHTQVEYNKAKAEFERLSFQERMLRPPNAPAQPIPTAWRMPQGRELDGIGPNR